MREVVGEPVALPGAKQCLARGDDLRIVYGEIGWRLFEHDLAHVGRVSRYPAIAGEIDLGAAVLRLRDHFRAGAKRLVAKLRWRHADAVNVARGDAGRAH